MPRFTRADPSIPKHRHTHSRNAHHHGALHTKVKSAIVGRPSPVQLASAHPIYQVDLEQKPTTCSGPVIEHRVIGPREVVEAFRSSRGAFELSTK